MLVAGGDFESAATGWTLSNGAAVLPEGNTLRPGSSANSLSLPSDAAATTPPTCVGKGDPVARIFARTLKPGKRGPNSLKVEVLYLDNAGSVRKVKRAGSLHASDDWAPSRRFALAQGQFSGHHPRHTAEIELRFTALAGSEWRIDDVFVDPRARN